MSLCVRCGASFSCAMVDGEDNDQPCWCTAMPPVLPVPSGATGTNAGCYCPACLRLVIAQQQGDTQQGHDNTK